MLPWCHLSLCPILFYNPAGLMNNQAGPCLFKKGQNSGQEGLREKGSCQGSCEKVKEPLAPQWKLPTGKKAGDGYSHLAGDTYREMYQDMGKRHSEHACHSCSPCSSPARHTKVPMSASRRWVAKACRLPFGDAPRRRILRLPTAPSLSGNLCICKVTHWQY